MLCNKESVTLKDIIIDKNSVKYLFDVTNGLKSYFNKNHLFIVYNESINLENVPKSILTIPFVASLIPLMWLTDSIMWVHEIDKTFYRSLTRIKQAYQEMYDHYPLKGNFIPAIIEDNFMDCNQKSLVLFSGGIDACTTYLRHKDENPLLFNIQGWYDKNTIENNRVAEKEIEFITDFSIGQNSDFMYAKSNFATIINTSVFHKKIEKKLQYTWWYGFQHSMSFISIAIPLCYKLSINKIYIASSYTLGDSARCASYITTDSEFEFANYGMVIHDGFELSRQDKVKIIVKYQKEINKIFPLKVCSFTEENCNVCEKCIRSMLAIIAENGNISYFGFKIEGDLLQHLKSIFEDRIIYFDVEGEYYKFWPYIKKRMKENYESITEKELVDWFLTEDLVGKRKQKLFEYRTKNFVSLVMKRLKGRK